MKIYISAKQIKRRNTVTAYPYVFETVPKTLRQLIFQLVADGVSSYNHRITDSSANPVISQDDMDTMREVGKIGFGIPFGSRTVEQEAALDTALQGFQDGLYRIFVGDQEIEEVDAPLNLQEGDSLTIIRLVMLTGGFF